MSNALSFHAKVLSNLPYPQVVETLDYEALLEQRIAQLNALQPLLFDSNHQPALMAAELVQTETETFWKVPLNADAGLFYLDLESEPMLRLLQADVYREMNYRNRLNQAALSLMPAFATGADLDHLASRDRVFRFLLVAEDLTTTPPTEAQWEDDERFRRRWLLSAEARAAGGSEGWYLYHALSADARIKDAMAISPTPRGVEIIVLSTEGNGAASAELLAIVEANIKAQYTEVMTDELTVVSAEVIEYSVDATQVFYTGSSNTLVTDVIDTEFVRYREASEKIGHEINEHAIGAVLHQEGVYRTTINTPAEADLPIVCTVYQAPYCTGLALHDGGEYGLL